MWTLTPLLATAFTVAISGAHGGLGRELVRQSLDRGWTPLALTRRPGDPVCEPYRGGWLADDERRPVPMPEVTAVDHAPTADFDALVLALGGKPFVEDDTTRVVRALCDHLPARCRRVCLVSAHGVGDSLRGANAGIQIMHAWYLKDTYAAKAEQERAVHALRARGVETLVLRPKALSYGRGPGTPRQALAADVLAWLDA